MLGCVGLSWGVGGLMGDGRHTEVWGCIGVLGCGGDMGGTLGCG